MSKVFGGCLHGLRIQLLGGSTLLPLNGATLSLLGTFGEDSDVFGALLAPGIILGVTADGKKVTLYRCHQSTANLGGGFSASSFRANYVFVGHHFESPDDIRLDFVSCSYTLLAEWAGRTGIKSSITTDPKGVFGRADASYEYPPPLIAHVGDTMVAFDHHVSVSGDRISTVKYEQTTFLRVTPPTRASL